MYSKWVKARRGLMSKANNEKLPRVNFFDGQKVTEADLDVEQIHHRGLVSGVATDFHGSGVLDKNRMSPITLFDTSMPGAHIVGDSLSVSEPVISAGSYDGRAIYLDKQPSDRDYGNRIEIEASGLGLGGRVTCKVLILGRVFSSLNSAGAISAEVVELLDNETKITENYYLDIIAVFFNNFSGGLGRTEYLPAKESENTLGNDGKIIFREATPLRVFSRTKSVSQTESPNIDLANFVTSSTENSLEDELLLAMGSAHSFSDLYFEPTVSEKIKFEVGGSTIRSYGQKFLAKANNLQKVELLLSVEENTLAPAGLEYEFSGDIVVSINRLMTDISCITDPSPDNLIDFDPEPSPIAEVSYSMEDLLSLGISLSSTPQKVSFDFSQTLLADPNISPSIDVDRYYAILISRRGSNSVGTLVLEKGYNKSSRKSDNGQTLSPEEQFGRLNQKFIEFDENNLVYVDDPDSSLWFAIHSDTVEVTSGVAYSEDGFPVVLPKTEDYVGSTRISSFLRNISLKSIAEGAGNWLALYREDEFTSPGTHPRTGNYVNTRIVDSPAVKMFDESDSDNFENPLILAKIVDNNVREAQDIDGEFDKPGLILPNEVVFINPSSELLSSNLIGRVITTDTECECNSRYRIINANCEVIYAGDLDGDGDLTSADIIELLNIVGNTINSSTTERKILGGEIDIINFLQSDLNGDGTVDGADIELIEDAVDGYINFAIEDSMKIMRLRLENILEESNYPTIEQTSSSTNSSVVQSGSTSYGGDNVRFVASSEQAGLAIRVGDTLSIDSSSLDAGSYKVDTKTISNDGVTVDVTVSELDGGEVSFIGSSNFDVEIISGTEVNVYADNLSLLNVPYTTKKWKISDAGAAHSDQFVDVYDLRRYVESSFIEEVGEECLCAEEECVDESSPGPSFRTQKILANDLFIPSGEIYKEPGVPYHGDIEYANITIPLPPGTIEDCEIDLYNNFIKADNGSCKTASGYPAMRFSDGTYVGCEDSGGETDITKGRVKISQAIASLHVDAFIGDGSAIDGYADAVSTATSKEIISESFVDYSYPNSFGFSEWPIVDPSGSTYFTVSAPSGYNIPASFTLSTINAGEREAGLEYPSLGLIDPISGDFVIDLTMSRIEWNDELLVIGKVSFFAGLQISNDDGTITTLEIGWRQNANQSSEIYYSGVIENPALGLVISDFDNSIPAKDDIGDEIRFRLRRVDDAIFGMYFDDTSVDIMENISGQFIKIGSTTGATLPGAGDAIMKVSLKQELNPNAGVNYSTRLHTLTIMHSLETTDDTDESAALVSRDSNSIINRAIATFPLRLTQRTNIVSASLEVTAAEAISSTEQFNVIPFDILNADNLGPIVDYPIELNDSFVTTFSPGSVSAGETLSIDITSIMIYFLSKTGHLPGFYKAVSIEPSSTAVGEMSLEPYMTIAVEYEDITTGVIFKVGASINPLTGVVSLRTKNILYDSLDTSNRTVLNFGVHLKKSGFRNNDVSIGIKDLARIGIGSCIDETTFDDEDLCFFIAGDTATGTFVEGPFPCNLTLP